MRFHLLLILFCAIAVQASAQTGSVRGFIYDKQSGEPVLFSPVFLKGTTFGATTDVNGFYSITRVPAGTYTLMVAALEYDTVTAQIEIKANDVVAKQLFVTKSVINLKGVDISAEREARKTEVQTSVTKITPKEIRMVPAVGGEPDLAQYLQVLPGVVFSGDQGGQLYIRGGTPVMNKVLLDGMIIYNPFHSIGLFSVFDTDILRNADVYTGGFSAEYGDRISSVMDITTRDGNKKRITGKLSGSTFSSKMLLEGPIKKQKDTGGSSASFVLSYKNSYLDKSSKVFYDYIDEDGLPYNFNDIYGKVSLNGENGSKLSVFGFSFEDNAKFEDIADIGWKSTGFGSNFILVPGGSNTLMDGVFAFSQYKVTQQEADDKPRFSLVNGFNLGLNFGSFINRDELKFGFEVLGFRTEYETYGVSDVKNEQVENTTEFGTFFKYRVTRDKFVIEPSVRFQYFASLSEFSPEPRIGMKFNVHDRLRIKAAAGLYAQNLISTVSDRDVVNLFYGFLSGPENLPDEFRGAEVKSKLQKSQDVIAGFEFDITKNLDLNVEFYHKKFKQLTNVNRAKVYPDNGQFSDKPDTLVKDFIIEEGFAQGMDVVLKYEFKKMYLWAVYSLGFVERTDESKTYTPHFDRRHNVNLVASYTFGKNLNWEVTARWNYGSGFPFTPTQSFYESLDFSEGLYTDPNTTNGGFATGYGEINSRRLPDYHRLDLSVKKSWLLTKNSNLEVIGSMINVYNRDNIFYFDRIRGKRIDQLPAIPSLGVNLTF